MIGAGGAILSGLSFGLSTTIFLQDYENGVSNERLQDDFDTVLKNGLYFTLSILVLVPALELSAPAIGVVILLSQLYDLFTSYKATASGDVHISTFDSLYYDFQAVGEFVLAKSNIPGDSFQIQVRLQQWFNSQSVSTITQLAMSLGSDRVTFDLHRPATVFVNGTASILSASNPIIQLSGGFLIQTALSKFLLVWNTGEVVEVDKFARYFLVKTALGPDSTPGSVHGLLGSGDGKANDLQLADGTVLQQPLSKAVLYGIYANAWRVTQDSSLFDYNAGETTATFTNLSFPRQALTLSDLPADLVAQAASAVGAAGIADPNVAAGAELDYIATNDPSFIAGASQSTSSSTPSTTAAAIVSGGPTLPTVGVTQLATTVTEAGSPTTTVTFKVYLSSVSTTDTLIGYNVFAPDTDNLGPAAFGGTFPSGTVTIAAGQTAGSFTINLASSVLGQLPSSTLEVEISTPNGEPIFASTAQTTIVNNQAVAGQVAVPVFATLADLGNFTQTGSAYTLDLGSLIQGQTLSALQFAVENAADAPADDLRGTFSAVDTSALTLSGIGPLTPIAAGGGEYSGIYAAINTTTLGLQSETLTFTPLDVNATGYQRTLPTLTLTIKDDVVAGAVASLLSPAMLVFQNARVGTAEDQAISIANTAPAGGAALAIETSTTGSAVTTGAVASLAAGAVDTSSVRVGLDTGASGQRSGSVTLNAGSVFAGGKVNVGQLVVGVSGSVYRPAVAAISPISTVVHVGDVGSVLLGISNADPADGYSENLLASLTSVSGPFSAPVGLSTGGVGAGASSRTLTINFSTVIAAQLTGTATLALSSDGGAAGTGIDGLGTLALPSQVAPLSVTVDNYASASLELLTGGGTLVSAGTNYTLDLGTVAQGTSPVVAQLGVTNSASGPADLLSGHFTLSNANAIGLTGFGDFAGLSAGQADGSLAISFDTSSSGTFTRTVTLTPTGSNASGYNAALAPETLTITGTVAATGTGSQPGNSTPTVSTSVYRFFDSHTGTQFLTSNESERDNVLATRPDLISEGVGLQAVVPASGDTNATPIYRFFDTIYGTHFYTSNGSERDTIVATRPDLTYEGIGFYEYTTPQPSSAAVYRFFESTNGTHFYTSSADERAGILATRTDLVPEGIAFYAPVST